MRGIQDKKEVAIIAPQAIVNNASFTQLTPGYLDTQGQHYVTYIVQLGAVDIALAALNVTECETTGGSYTIIPLSDFSVSPLTLPSATDDNHLFAVHIRMDGNRMRYQKLVVTMGSGSTGGFVSSIAILDPEQLPYNAITRGLTQDTIV